MSENKTNAQVNSANNTEVETDVETVETRPDETVNDGTTCAERLSGIYGALRGVRDDFTDIVGLFRSVQKFDKDLQAVIKWHLPSEINKVTFDDDGVCDTSLTDEGYAQWLANALKGRQNVLRMNTLAQLARMLREGIKDLRRKQSKLAERVKAQGATTAEGRAAALLKGKVDEGMRILEGRLVDVCDKFCVTRKRMFSEMATLTKLLVDSAFSDGGKNKDKMPNEITQCFLRNMLDEDWAVISEKDGDAIRCSDSKYRYNPNIQ